MASLESRVTEPVDWAEENGNSQLDGATQNQRGSEGVLEPEFDVEVKLVDENSPLFSIKTFEELGLLVSSRTSIASIADRLQAGSTSQGYLFDAVPAPIKDPREGPSSSPCESSP